VCRLIECATLQEMKQAHEQGKMRSGELNTHDKAFKLEMQALTLQTKKAYTA
jgi:hypothetical protein